MKKILCFLVLACLIFGTAFAQARPATPPPAPAQPAQPAPAKPAEDSKVIENALGLDIFQLCKGFIASDKDSEFLVFIISTSYERLVAPHFSIGGDIDLYLLKFDKIDGSYFSLALEGRYYPMSNFENFFVGTTIGFNVLTIDGSTDNGGFKGLTTSLKSGYKIVLNKSVYLEPSLAYVLSKSSTSPSLGGLASLLGISFPSVPTPLGWNGGLRFGFVF